MQIIADLHIHSKYSRAVSPQMNLVGISSWASKKGISLVGTSDWTHPLWFKEIQDNLTESNSGIYRLKSKEDETRFILTTEISSIYSQGGKVRRVHNVILLPSLDVGTKVNKELIKRGANLMADGRPIVGISSLDILKILLEIDDDILLIPAHIWTPWFSIFGSKSGFDSLSECFGEYAKYIYGIETGLSSDPIMNWQIKELENRSILSSSDAHSGPKLGREATVFIPKKEVNYQISDLKYEDIANAIKQDPKGELKIGYTIEFFPEEGKYHFTGHRLCKKSFSISETRKNGIICPVCNKPMTVGVESRVADLSSKIIEKKDLFYLQNKVGLTFVCDKEKKHRPFVSMVPLIEILLEINNGSPTKALSEYNRIIGQGIKEFEILLKKTYEEISDIGGNKLMKAIKIVRERKVTVNPGYDGEFGVVKVFNNHEEKKEQKETQSALF